MSAFSELIGIIIVVLRTVFFILYDLVGQLTEAIQNGGSTSITLKSKSPNYFPFVKANARDPQYQTLAGLTDEAAFGAKKNELPKPKAPDASQDFIKASPRDPQYQTLALVQNVEFVDDGKKKQK